MSQEEYLRIRARYQTYCHAFISIAGQIKHLEAVHGLDLHVTKDRMWSLLTQMIQDKPDWA